MLTTPPTVCHAPFIAYIHTHTPLAIKAKDEIKREGVIFWKKNKEMSHFFKSKRKCRKIRKKREKEEEDTKKKKEDLFLV